MPSARYFYFERRSAKDCERLKHTKYSVTAKFYTAHKLVLA